MKISLIIIVCFFALPAANAITCWVGNESHKVSVDGFDYCTFQVEVSYEHLAETRHKHDMAVAAGDDAPFSLDDYTINLKGGKKLSH